MVKNWWVNSGMGSSRVNDFIGLFMLYPHGGKAVRRCAHESGAAPFRGGLPHSAGVVIDAIRCYKLALDRGKGGTLYSPSAYFMKHPPKQFTDPEAHRMTEEFIARGQEDSPSKIVSSHALSSGRP